MNYSLYKEKNDFFSIITVSFLFHLAIIAAFALAIWLRPAKENPPPIHFFEMINVAAPSPPPQIQEPTHAPRQEPAPPQKPELKPEPKPEPKPLAKPEPKPAPATKTPTPEPIQTESKSTEPSMDMPMDLPSDIKSKDMEMPALRTVGNIMMDPQLQAYLNTIMRLLYQNFNPPAGTEISRGTKSSVQFKIARNGEISEVVLRTSSGNSIWDRLAVRAVQITKPPPLPPSYTADNLPLIFDFREK